MSKQEITNYYDANIKSKLVEIMKNEVSTLENTHVNDMEELYFIERDGVFSDYVHWRKNLRIDNDFIGFVKRFSSFYNESKLRQPPETSPIIHFNLKWTDFTNEHTIENKANEKQLSYFLSLNDELQNDIERDSAVYERVEELKSEGKWGLKLDENSPQFAVVCEPNVIKTHRDYLLDEVVWLATDFHMEKRWKRNNAKKLAQCCKRVCLEKADLKNQSLQTELLAKKHTKQISKIITDFWTNINKIKQIKIKKYIEYEKQQELNERLKNFVDKTQQYSSNIANKLTTVGSTSNTSENDIYSDEFDPNDLNEDSDQLEEDMKEFIDEENMIDNSKLDEELDHLNNDIDMSLDDLIKNLPKEYLEDYRKNAEKYETNNVDVDNNKVLMGSSNLVKKKLSNADDDLNEVVFTHQAETDDNPSDIDNNSVISTSALSSYGSDDPNFDLMVENANRYKPTGTTISTANCKIEHPFLLRGTLREYQLVGLNWLMSLHDNNLNGILADEMGLGKTIQTIALIAHLAGTVGEWGPHLVIVPSSVILNWECEFKKWCPSLKVLAYYGRTNERKSKRNGWSKENAFHVCITSFQLAIQDNIMFKKRRWYYLIIDEAHNIRNSNSVRWKMLLGLNTQRRLLLTGTPLQNNLMELWSLLHFLMPQLFKCEDAFRQWFAQPISSMVFNESSVDESTISKLHQILRPFILRRLKCEVELQIPKKYEHVIQCELSPRQRNLYNDYMMLDSTKSVLHTGNFMSVMQVLIQLRKVCNHPDLFEPRPVVSPFVTESSGCFRTQEIPSICDLSQSYLSSVDEFRMLLLKNHPLLKATIQFSSPSKKEQTPKLSRKRKADDSSTLVGINEDNTSTNLTNSSNKISTEYYVKRFAKFVDVCIDKLTNSNNHSISNDEKLVNGNHLKFPTSNYNFRGLNDNIKILSSKTCECSYKCNGCGSDQWKDNISVPTLRTVVEEDPSNEHYIQLLKQQTINNITRILEFSKFQTINSDNFLDSDFIQQSSYKNNNLKSLDVNSTSSLSALFNVSTNLLEQYVPYAIREVLISAIRVVSFSFELVKYSNTASLRSTKCFLEQLSHSINSYCDELIKFNNNNNEFNVFDNLWRVYINRQLTLPQTRLIQYDCGKLQFLDGFLKKLFSEGHRVLIFTQMAKMLDILEKFLAFHHLKYLRLDGSTKIEHRQYMMDLFNNDDSIFAFILSTRAGGLGLNLTGADTVIFYDNDWNPTVDAQAQDRCHRIGQIRDVHIYRLVCRNTVEENILKRAQQKRMLADVTIEGGNFTVSQLEENFITEIFGQDSNETRHGLIDTTNFENDLKCAEKTEGIDDIDVASNTKIKNASNRHQPSAYDDFCEEIFTLENDMLPVERFALNYLETMLIEELDQATNGVVGDYGTATANDHHHTSDTLALVKGDTINNTKNINADEIDITIPNKENSQVIYENNNSYFKPSAELYEYDNIDTDGENMIHTDENVQFGNFIMQDIKKISSNDGDPMWLPRGTNCYSILNDVYNLEPTNHTDNRMYSPLINKNVTNNTNTAHNIANITDHCSDEINETPEIINNNNISTDQLQILDIIRSYTNNDGSQNTHITNVFDNKLLIQDLCWLLRPNFYDFSLTNKDIDFKIPSINHWNNNYYYADNPNDDLISELFFQKESLSVLNSTNAKHLNKYPDIYDKSFSNMLDLMVSALPTNSIKTKVSKTICCFSDFPRFARAKNTSHKDKCYGTFSITCPKRIMIQLYGVMVDVLEKETDTINWEFFKFTFGAISQSPYPISHRHFHSWSLNNKKQKSKSSYALKYEKILGYIANKTNKLFVRTKNLKYQRVYKDIPNISLLPLSAVSKYSQFCTTVRTIQKDSQAFNNKRSTLNRIHDRIKKKHLLTPIQHANQLSNMDNSTTTSNSGATPSGGYNNQRRTVQNKFPSNNPTTSDKMSFVNQQQKRMKLPSLLSSVRKRRALLESNVMMYNQDKIAKVKQHVSRISINDHLLLYRDMNQKAIKYVKYVDGKFVKVPPTIPPVAVSNLNLGTHSRIGTNNNNLGTSRTIIHSNTNVKPFSNPVTTVPRTMSTTTTVSSGIKNQFSNITNTSSTNNSHLNYPQQAINRAANYQRLNMPKTAAISINNNTNQTTTSNAPTPNLQHKTPVATIPATSKNTNNFTYNQNPSISQRLSTNHNNPSMISTGTAVSSNNSATLNNNTINNIVRPAINAQNVNNNNNTRKVTTNYSKPSNDKIVQPSSSSSSMSGMTVRGGISHKPSNNAYPIGDVVNAPRHTQPQSNSANIINNKLMNTSIASPLKLANQPVNKNIGNIQRAIGLQQRQQFTPTSEKCETIPEVVNSQMNYLKYHDQPQQHLDQNKNLQTPQHKQQFHQPQKQTISYIPPEQITNAIINNSPIKINNYNQPLSSGSNSISYSDTVAMNTGSTDSSNSRSNSIQPNVSAQYNQIINQNNIGGRASTDSLTTNNSSHFNNRQNVAICPPTPNNTPIIQQTHQNFQPVASLQNITTTRQLLLHRINTLQHQLTQVQQQQSTIPSHVYQQLEQQNLCAQQQLQQQLIQLQQQHFQMHNTRDESNNNNTNSQSSASYDISNNYNNAMNNTILSKINNSSAFSNSSSNTNINHIPSSNNNMMLHQLQSSLSSVGNASSSSVNMMSASNSTTNHIDKNQTDILTLLNNIINSGGNVPNVLQHLLRGNNRDQSEPNVNVANNRATVTSSTGGVMIVPSTNISNNQSNVINQSNLRHFIQQPHSSTLLPNVTQQQQLQQQQQQQQLQQGVNPNNRLITGVSTMYHNMPPTSQQNFPTNISVNHPSFNEMNTVNNPSESSAQSFSNNVGINPNVYKNISQNDIYNFLVNSKSNVNNNNIQLNYSALQQLMSKGISKTNPQSGGNNRGNYNPNNPGYPNNNP